MAKFEGVDLLGNVESKTSTFFPDSWTPARVESAIESAFDVREPVYNRLGEVLPNKWQARVDGVLIEGMFSRDSTATFESAKLYDVGTAYPKYEP